MIKVVQYHDAVVETYGQKLVGSGTAKEAIFDFRQISRLELENMKKIEYLNLDHNPLKSLKGLPKNVVGLRATMCELETLDCPQLQTNAFDVSNNKQLTSLKGGPKSAKIIGARNCNLKELDCENLALEELDIGMNKELTSLEGCPQANNIHAYDCGLTRIGLRDMEIDYLAVNANSSLSSLRECPKCSSLVADINTGLLFAVGRVKSLTIRWLGVDSISGNDSILSTDFVPTTVFRSKLWLMSVSKKCARL